MMESNKFTNTTCSDWLDYFENFGYSWNHVTYVVSTEQLISTYRNKRKITVFWTTLLPLCAYVISILKSRTSKFRTSVLSYDILPESQCDFYNYFNQTQNSSPVEISKLFCDLFEVSSCSTEIFVALADCRTKVRKIEVLGLGDQQQSSSIIDFNLVNEL